jgi:hypothetical protein
MSVRIHQCRVLDAAPDVVWRSIEDISTHVEWMKDAVEIRFVTEQHAGVGAQFWCLTKVGPLSNRDVLVVTEWQPGEVMGIKHTGVVTGTGRFTLMPDETGIGASTRMCWEEVLRFPWWMGGPVGERAARPLLGRIWQKNLARLNERMNGRIERGKETEAS